MPSFRLDRIAETHAANLVQVLDLQAGNPGIRRMRAWVIEALALDAGDHALDIGSGTGSEVIAMAEVTGPNGDAVGLEPNPTILAIAEERATAAGSSARFVAGDAYTQPFEDATFDAIRCERVYQHLTDPERATAEIARVLRPGGRVVLVDSDWATSIIHPGDAEIIRAFTDRRDRNTPNAFAGRRLRGQLAAAGLAVDEVRSESVITEADGAQTLIRMVMERAVDEGFLTTEQREKFVTEFEAGVQRGDFHFSVTMFAALAHKPATA